MSNEDVKTTTIGTRQGLLKDMLEARTFHTIWVKTDHPVGASAPSGGPISRIGRTVNPKN